jgi:hypothetical protein
MFDDLERSGLGLKYILFQNLPGGNEENHKNLMIANGLADIRTEYLPKTNLNHYL